MEFNLNALSPDNREYIEAELAAGRSIEQLVEDMAEEYKEARNGYKRKLPEKSTRKEKEEDLIVTLENIKPESSLLTSEERKKQREAVLKLIEEIEEDHRKNPEDYPNCSDFSEKDHDKAIYEY